MERKQWAHGCVWWSVRECDEWASELRVLLGAEQLRLSEPQPRAPLLLLLSSPILLLSSSPPPALREGEKKESSSLWPCLFNVFIFSFSNRCCYLYFLVYLMYISSFSLPVWLNFLSFLSHGTEQALTEQTERYTYRLTERKKDIQKERTKERKTCRKNDIDWQTEC